MPYENHLGELTLICAVVLHDKIRREAKAAVEAAADAVGKVSGVVSQHIIAKTEESTEKMLKLNAFDKN